VRIGIVAAAAAVALAFLIVRAHAGWPWGLAELPIAWLSALGFIQAAQRTCVAYAARRTCNFDAGEARIDDDALAAALAARAKRISLWSGIAAIAVTGAVIWLGT
jgi:hypothetical protein